MSELGVALVGCGEIAETNAKALDRAAGVRLAMTVDPRPGAAERIAGPRDAPIARDIALALADARVDAVLIAAPHHLHAPLALAAIAARRAVILEKPLAHSLADADRVIDAAERAGVPLAVLHPRRYEDKVRQAAALVREGRIGSLVLTISRFLKRKEAEYWREEWRGDPARSGGGIGVMNLIHHLDLLEGATGDTIEEIRPLAANLATPEAGVEDTWVGTLRYRSGALGTIAAGSALIGPTAIDDELIGTQGRVRIDKHEIAVASSTGAPYHPKEWRSIPADGGAEGKVRFLEEFAACIRAGRRFPVDGREGRRLLALALGGRCSP